MYVSSYNLLLVAASLFVAILASYTALDMAGRITTAQGRAARWWLAGGASAMGVGIWSMHFIGMLAFSLPIPLGYDPVITLLSLLIAIASSVFALWLVCQENLPWSRLALGAILMGLGIASMHYTGMAAMRMIPLIHYIPSLFILSIVIAIVASGAALWIAFHLRRPRLARPSLPRRRGRGDGLCHRRDALHRDGGRAVLAREHLRRGQRRRRIPDGWRCWSSS